MPTYNPYDRAHQDDPQPLYRQLRDEAPVYHSDELDFWALSRYEDVLPALLNPKVLSGSHGSSIEGFKKGNNLTYKDPPEHSWHRSPLVMWFTPREIAKLEPLIRGAVVRLLDEFVPTGRMEAVTDFASRVPVEVISVLMGIPDHQRERVRDLASASLTAPDADKALTPLEAGVQARDELFDILRELLAEHRARPTDDLVSRLLAQEFTDDDGNVLVYDDYEYLSRLREFAVAGHETTSKLIANGLMALWRHPAQRRELAQNPALIPNAIEEMLRYDGPTHYLGRWTYEDVTLHGTTIPEDSRVILLLNSANHDERHFPDADSFDIHRHIDRHVAFGFGPHLCLGAALARLEAKIGFEELLARAPEYDIVESGVERFYGSILHGLSAVPLVFDASVPVA